jgi:FkbM family methyltransferase
MKLIFKDFRNFLARNFCEIKNTLRKIRGYFFNMYRQKILSSYSQYGEDRILDELLQFRNAGFYVDVGANDPIKFNNTYRFYKRGWRGINIEPNPNLFAKILKVRKFDINLNYGVAKTIAQLTFFKVLPDTLSTFNKEVAYQAQVDGYEIEEALTIEVRPLREILDSLDTKRIDFLSIDVEGLEEEVLLSNNWTKFRPNFIVLEINRNGERLRNILRGERYIEIFNNDTNAIFRDAID